MKIYHLKYQSGLTLIELMIALTLSLVLLAGVIQIFIANKASYRMTEAHSRLQENARFALDILTRDVRSAGYTGCRTIENMNVVTIAKAPVPAVMNATTIINGLNAETSSTWNIAPDATLGTVVGGTDVITIQRATGCGGNLIGNIGSSNGNIQIYSPNSCNISANDVLVIADCEDAHVFRAANVSDGTNKQTIAHSNSVNEANHFCTSYASLPDPGACATGEAKLYTYDAELFLFRAYTYYIRNGINGTPALWRLDHSQTSGTASNPIELIEGIENMQITYGVDNDNNDIVDSYENAKTVEDGSLWGNVVSARISLLAQTLEDNLTVENQSLIFDGTNIPGNDGKLRRVFTTTIGIRNRVQ